MISRRSFLTALATSTTTLSISQAAHSLVGGSTQALSSQGLTSIRSGHLGSLVTEHVSFSLKELPLAFDGYKIGFLSDLHLGIWMPEDFLVASLEVVKNARCDILVLGGDFIGVPENPWWEKSGFVWNEGFAGLSKDQVIPKIFSRMHEILGHFNFPDGIISVPGNHEHWNSTRAFLDVFRRSPVCRLLINEWISIERSGATLDFFGADDFLTGIPRLPTPPELDMKARSIPRQAGQPDQEPSRCNVLVSHNPDLVSFGLNRDGESFPFSLSVSGHTHGGQVRVPGLGALTYQVFDRRFGEGRVELFGKHTYTSRGVGVVSVPFRLDCPPEVTIITLKR